MRTAARPTTSQPAAKCFGALWNEIAATYNESSPSTVRIELLREVCRARTIATGTPLARPRRRSLRSIWAPDLPPCGWAWRSGGRLPLRNPGDGSALVELGTEDVLALGT